MEPYLLGLQPGRYELIMLYHISGLSPRGGMSGAGFSIQLWPKWKEAVSQSQLTQGNVNHAISTMGRMWLDNCGFNAIFDPDNCGAFEKRNSKPGPRARPMYQENIDLMVKWGEWGPEHINVPGNACGLDIDSGFGAPPEGKVLHPHNVDTIRQAHLLLVVFLFFAETFVLNDRLASYDKSHKALARA